MRIFVGHIPIGNYYALVAKGLNEIGLEAEYISFWDNPYRFCESEQKGLVGLVSKVGHLRVKIPRSQYLRKLIVVCLHELLRLVFIPVWAFIRYDVFIFSFGHTLVPGNLDLGFYRLLGKKTIFVFNGSDVRPDYLDGSLMAYDRGNTIADCIKNVRQKKKRLVKIEKFADVIVNWSAQSILMNRPYVEGLIVGVLNLEDEHLALNSPPLTSNRHVKRKLVRILHCPTHPQAKGTFELREIINRIRKHHDIEWIEVIGLPNNEVIEEIKRCDFVVDQLYSDTPMAGFALEAAWYGKAAVIGGYYARSVKRVIDVERIPPSEFVEPDAIEEAIKRLIVDSDYRVNLGKSAQEFVALNWNRRTVAKRWKRIIEGDIPPEWSKKPNDIQYFHGCGLSEKRASQLLRQVIHEGGPRALQLDDRSCFRNAILEFFKIPPN